MLLVTLSLCARSVCTAGCGHFEARQTRPSVVCPSVRPRIVGSSIGLSCPAAVLPPGKPLQPRLQMKVDELFLRRLSKTDRHPALHNGLPHIQGENSDPATSDLVCRKPVIPRLCPFATTSPLLINVHLSHNSQGRISTRARQTHAAQASSSPAACVPSPPSAPSLNSALYAWAPVSIPSIEYLAGGLLGGQGEI